jgi:DNA-directed RNA polymerase specialized sigma subunit
MTNTEAYLKGYWYAKQNYSEFIEKLKDTEKTRDDYIDTLRERSLKMQNGYGGTSVVERACIIITDQMSEDIIDIQQNIERERRVMREIENALDRAGLDSYERRYVRLRYFQNLSTIAVEKKLYCSNTTAWRIRTRALKKVEALLHGKHNR